MSDVAKILKSTPKGRLRYDRESLTGVYFQATIDKICKDDFSISIGTYVSSPPGLKTKASPKIPGKSSYRDQIEETSNGQIPNYDNEVEILDSYFELQEYERMRRQQVREKLENKLVAFKTHDELMTCQANEDLNVINHENTLRRMKLVEQMKQEQSKELTNMQEKRKRMNEHSKQHLKLLNAKIKEAEMKHKIQEQMKKDEEAARQKQISAIEQILIITENFLTQMKTKIEQCSFKKYISADTMNAVSQIEAKKAKIQESLLKGQAGVLFNSNDIVNAETTLSSLQSTLQIVITNIDEANIKGEQELKEKLVAEKKEADKINHAISEKEKKESMAQEKETNILAEYMSPDSMKTYVYLKDNLKSWQDSIKPLLNNSSLKKYRFDLQKVVNTTVNTIGKTSGAHLRDRLNKLFSLLSGVPVEVGNQTVQASSHEMGLKFCKELLAKKLVRQGEEQVASNHDSAFAFAAVIVAMSTDFPDVGDLILGHFYERCPYLVPYYVPKQEGQSKEEYYRALGYTYTDEVIERQDKFLKRMGGIIRLYAAIAVSPMPMKRFTSEQSKQNRHGIRYAWLWFARILNLDPRPDITATLIFNFLEVAGHDMSRVYGKQFQKCLHCMCSEYFPKIKAVTSGGNRGPLQRLQTLLQKTVSNQGHFPKPQGYLDANFWSSTDS